MKHTAPLFRLFSVMFLLLFCVGCGKEKKVFVTALSSAENGSAFEPGASFSIVSEMQGSLANRPLLAKQITRKIERALKARGFKVNNVLPADYELSFMPSVSSKQVTETVPRYMPYYRYGFSSYYGYYQYYDGGYVLVPEERTYYAKQLEITVKKRGLFSRETVWSASASSENQWQNYQMDIDTLVSESFKYFGVNSK